MEILFPLELYQSVCGCKPATSLGRCNEVIGSDYHVLFWDFEDFWKKTQKGGKLENLGSIGLLH